MTETGKPRAPAPPAPSAPSAPSDAYNPEAVESKWQRRWAEDHTNEPDLARAERPFYNLMMFPYPSAEGLHVGNMFAFTGSDVYGRFKRLQGYDVFEPIGYDAFGIHSENYAIKMGINPAILIPKNIENFRRQLKRIGGMFDWRHELSTTDPDYYKWTQWVFLQLFKAGKAYKKSAAVNWCPFDKTVLANEQVINGHCERCGNAVEMKPIGNVSAEDKPLTLRVSGMPAARCAKGHAAPIDRDFMLWLIHELKNRGGALPAGNPLRRPVEPRQHRHHVWGPAGRRYRRAEHGIRGRGPGEASGEARTAARGARLLLHPSGGPRVAVRAR